MDNLWHTRFLLASPTTSLRELRGWCRCLTVDGSSPISHTRIGIVRAAWVCLLQELRKGEVKASVAAAPMSRGRQTSPVHVRHLHDGAMMQFKSYSEVPTVMAQHFSGSSMTSSRGRYSSVQNNLMHVSVGS
eukprot:5378079-Pyramimonas_sp.AAC.1